MLAANYLTPTTLTVLPDCYQECGQERWQWRAGLIVVFIVKDH